MNNSSSKSVVDNVLKSLSKKFNHLSRVFSGLKKLKEARHICSHFSSFLEPVVANNSTLKTEVFKIRHHVYCEELGFEKIRENGQETDEFDAFSQYCLIRHRSSGQLAGTVRLVTPKHSGEQLPIEKYCLDSITNPSLNPSNFPREQICEISRLAVPRAFRRRQMDNFDGAATGVINTHTFSDTELRCFPFIAVGLYFTAASLAMSQNIKHAYVMMEPRLARSMRFIGIKFDQIGPVIDYHGKRAPYYINQPLLLRNLSAGFKTMLTHIHRNVKNQINHSKQ